MFNYESAMAKLKTPPEHVEEYILISYTLLYKTLNGVRLGLKNVNVPTVHTNKAHCFPLIVKLWSILLLYSVLRNVIMYGVNSQRIPRTWQLTMECSIAGPWSQTAPPLVEYLVSYELRWMLVSYPGILAKL